VKPVKRVDVSKLTPDERAALSQLVRDAKAAGPDIKALRDTAKTVFSQWLKSPRWGIAEGEGEQPQDLWHVGAPTVNYVDHIERPS
jgi:hypothetical protein